MAKINWTAEAELWLKDIYDFIAQDNPKAAARVVSGIYKKAQILKVLIITDSGEAAISAFHADISHRGTEDTKKSTWNKFADYNGCGETAISACHADISHRGTEGTEKST